MDQKRLLTDNKIAILALLVALGVYMYTARETIRATYSLGFVNGSRVQAAKVICWQDPENRWMSFDPRAHSIKRGCERVLELRNEELLRASR